MKKQLLFISATILLLTATCLLPTFASAQTLAAGYHHSLTICSDNTVMAWGENFQGHLGNGTVTNSSVPVPTSFLTNIIAIDGGHAHSIALKNDSTVWTWGDNSLGQLGNGTIINSSVPLQVTALTGIIAIAAGGNHSIALKSDSTVWTWGNNFYGSLGNGAPPCRRPPAGA